MNETRTSRVPPIGEPDEDLFVVWEGSNVIFSPSGDANRWSSSKNAYSYVPGVFRWFVPFNASLQLEGCGGRLDGRTKQLAILTTSVMNDSPYSIGHNLTLGRAVGLEDEVYRAIRNPELRSRLAPRDAAVIEWAQLVTSNQARYDEGAFERLKPHFDLAEIIELTWLVGMFNMINRVNDSLHLYLEEQRSVNHLSSSRSSTEQTLVDYAKKIVERFDRSKSK